MDHPLLPEPKLITPEFADWFLRFLVGSPKNPTSYKVSSQLVEKDKDRRRVRITLKPVSINYIDNENNLRSIMENKAKLGLVLAKEDLDKVASLTLLAQVSTTCKSLTLSPEQVLSVMVFFHLLATDYARSRNGISALLDNFCDEAYVPGTEPVFRMKDIMNTWIRYGTARINGLLVDRNAGIGIDNDPTIIPPRWGYIELYELIDRNGEPVQGADYVRVPSLANSVADLPQLYETILGEAQPEDPNILKQVGDKWMLVFQGGKPFYLNNLKGLIYINVLLRNPGQEIPCAKLQRYGAPGAESLCLRPARKKPQDDLGEGYAYGDELSKQEIFDDRALKKITTERDRLMAIKEEFQEKGDHEGADRVQHEINELEHYVSQQVGLKGRKRTFTDPGEKARQAVTKAVNQAIQKIQKHDGNMAGYLNQTIETGLSCIYKPYGEQFIWSLH